MKMSGKVLAFLLAISFVLSSVAFVAFADDAIESPIIPVTPQVFEYEYNGSMLTAVVKKFNKASGKTAVTIPSTVKKSGVTYTVVGIAAEAFKEASVKSVSIPEGVTSIGADAFLNCTQLTTIEFPNSLSNVAETAFDGTAWLAAQPDGVVYTGKVAFKAKGVSAATVTLAADTVAIADGAFRGQTTLEKIFIPDATTIGNEAFAGCTGVTIYCYDNSPAHIYAQENSIDFVVIPALVLKSAPAKLEYLRGEELNLDGIELIYVCEAGETVVAVTEEMISGFDASLLGTQTVTITYESKTVTFTVEVITDGNFIPGDVDGSGELDTDDAIYLLYHVNFKESYPINQPADFDGNGVLDTDDAIYLLYHVNFKETYPLH